jgi:FkbM family methyltransferase
MRKLLARTIAGLTYRYSRVSFARGYGRLGRLALAISPKGCEFHVRRQGASWSLRSDPKRWHAECELLLYGRYEVDTTAMLLGLVKPWMCCLDVGANIGYYSVLLAQRSKKVISFEPVDEFRERLIQHLRLNKLDNVDVVPLALSEKVDTVLIHTTSGSASIPARHYHNMADAAETTIQTIPLDEYVAQQRISQIDLIKLDIDGHEPQFLAGAERTLRTCKPILVTEMIPECLGGVEPAIDYCQTLINFGYELRPAPDKPAFASAAEAVKANIDGTNMLCLPL